MNTSTLNKLFGLFIILLILFFIYYPGYYEQKLQKDILTEKEAEMLEWSKEFCLKLEEQNIITGIREKSEQEVKEEIELIMASTAKTRAERIKKIERILRAEKGASKWLGDERNEKIKKQIKEHEKMIKYVKNLKPEVYKYSNVERLINYMEQSPYHISFWEIKDIEMSNFRKMPVDDAKTYLIKNAVFTKIISSDNIEDKNSISIKPGDEDHKMLTDAFLSNGLKVLSPQDSEYGLWQFMKLLKFPESQICMLIDRYCGDYRYKISSFYQYMRIFLVSLIIILPVLYIISEHRVNNAVNLYPINKEWTPSIWQVMRGSSVSIAIFFYVILIIPGIMIFAVFIEEILGFGYRKIYSFPPLAFFSLTTITFIALPVLLKTLKVKRLFRIGGEVECIFTEELYSGARRSTKNAYYNVYSYTFNGETYSVKEIQHDNQTRFIPGKTKLTALVCPANPDKAIVKENYLPNAESIKYEIPGTDESFKDFCVVCGLEGYEAICPNCEQICHALENDPGILDSYNKGDWSFFNFVCSLCTNKLEIDDSESDSNKIYCPKCKWSVEFDKNISFADD